MNICDNCLKRVDLDSAIIVRQSGKGHEFCSFACSIDFLIPVEARYVGYQNWEQPPRRVNRKKLLFIDPTLNNIYSDELRNHDHTVVYEVLQSGSLPAVRAIFPDRGEAERYIANENGYWGDKI